MDRHRFEFHVARMASVLEVSRAGYYAWRRRGTSARGRANQALAVEIGALFEDSDRQYGVRRMQRVFRRQGRSVGRHRIARLMRQQGLWPRRRRRVRPTTDARHALPVAPNRLQRDFRASEPNRRWAGDISFIPTGEGWLYLAVILDLYSRRVVGWAMGARITQQLTRDALHMALRQRRPDPGLLHHTDRGSQYAAGEYQLDLEAVGGVCSMSRRGDCYDNAVVESFFSTLKTELVHRRRWPTRAAAQAEIFEWIEARYNRKRLHSTLDYRSPVEYEEERQLTSTPCPRK